MSPVIDTIGSVKAYGWGSLVFENDFESIATISLSTTSATASFTSIPSTYRHLQIRQYAFTATNSPNTLIRFNSDTGNNYANHQLYGFGSGSVLASGNQDIDYILGVAFGNNSTSPHVGIIDILDYKDTNKHKTVRILTGFDTNGGGYAIMRYGVWMNTNAISSIQLPISSGSYTAYSHFALYGIKE